MSKRYRWLLDGLTLSAILVVGAASAVSFAAARGRVRSAPGVSELYTYDLTPTDSYDMRSESGRNNAWAEVHMVSALQGLVNRDRPHLYVYYVGGDTGKAGGIDRFWLDQIRAPEGWLPGVELIPVGRIEDLVRTFRKRIRGVVLYDLRIPATSNAASTAAGCENLLPVPYDPTPGSVYDRIVRHGPRLPVRVRLLNRDGSRMFTGAQSGSAKCDVYLWARRRYLDTGRCDPAVMAYYLDSWWLREPDRAAPNCHSLSNHDYFVAHKAFFFDLSPWDDETPCDDPQQPLGTDYRTLTAILRSGWNRTRGSKMIDVGGFVPWLWKYTDAGGGKHGGVASEWRYASILSCFNAYMDADALGLNAMANASVFSHCPLRDVYPQSKPGPEKWRHAGYLDTAGKVAPRTYVSFYVGDYDSAAWLYQRLPTLWNDPNRGKIPLGWAFNPNLAERFPVGMDWARRRATPEDFFIAGDSGAGYLNPGNLDGERPYSHLPSGVAVWGAHCEKWYRLWDISLTGFVIDGDARPMSPEALNAYAAFSPDGIVAQKLPHSQGVTSGAPYLVMGWDMADGNNIDDSFARIRESVGSDKGAGPHFHIFRTILWTPTQHRRLMERVQTMSNVTVVDPYTLMGLLRIYEKRPKAGG